MAEDVVHYAVSLLLVIVAAVASPFSLGSEGTPSTSAGPDELRVMAAVVLALVFGLA